MYGTTSMQEQAASFSHCKFPDDLTQKIQCCGWQKSERWGAWIGVAKHSSTPLSYPSPDGLPLHISIQTCEAVSNCSVKACLVLVSYCWIHYAYMYVRMNTTQVASKFLSWYFWKFSNACNHSNLQIPGIIKQINPRNKYQTCTSRVTFEEYHLAPTSLSLFRGPQMWSQILRFHTKQHYSWHCFWLPNPKTIILKISKRSRIARMGANNNSGSIHPNLPATQVLMYAPAESESVNRQTLKLRRILKILW